MTITLPLQADEEAKLLAAAKARGLSPNELVYEAIGGILEQTAPNSTQTQTRSLRGLLAKYGTAPSAEEIEESRREMLANFPRD